ncbi:prolyl endopeptidase-like [Tubulanus polymorphus]|uniref:prolyl endopeptidase-like n=1 Tax=Tubulanus polymorphus TaxID=672921 RepID=UPI003DA4571F
MKIVYPSARRDETVVEDYHGKKISDPYRWLEDPDADETKKFVDAQNDISMPFLKSCEIRDKIQNKITEKWDFPKYGCPFKRGSHYFYYHNSGLQNQSVLYVQDSLDGEPRVFLDPNLLSDDGTTALRTCEFSEDGEIFAYCFSEKGSDWVSVKFRSVSTGEDLADVITRVKFTSLAWTHDHKGIFYNSYPEEHGEAHGRDTASNLNQKLYYHRLGTEQTDDVLCAEFPDHPKWMIGAEVSDCGRYLLILIRKGCDPVNRLYYTDLEALPNGIEGILPLVKIVDNFDAEYDYVTNNGTVFTFKTNHNAPRYKLINIDFSNHDMEQWITLVDQHEKDVLEWAACVNENKLVLCYLHDVKNVLYLYSLESGTRQMEFPLDIGSIMGYSGRRKDTQLFYQFKSFLTPGIIFNCDLTQPELKPTVFREIKVSGLDTSLFEVKQVFYPSKDGTKIPMFIIHRKGIALDGSHPTVLYGYGGFTIPISPYFSVSRITFVQHLGGIACIANIRGGGEYGEDWHKAGMIANKQNVFDDFHAAAQYLIDHKYTQPKKLAIEGGSNGGLLVGACLNQRPELYGCGIAHVGVMDMLRFHKFTIGHAWTTEYGCSEKPEEFETLIKYSPIHNIAVPAGDNQYPAVLLLTADHDDRVVPLHSLKYMAQLHHVMSGVEKQTNPLMIRVDTKSGHGFGKPTAKLIEELTDVYSFMTLTMGMEWHD